MDSGSYYHIFHAARCLFSLITWEAPGDAYAFKLYYYTLDNGLTWKLIDTLTVNAGSYWWPVPVVVKDKTKCKVKVVLRDAANNTVGSDVNASTFTITPF